MKRKKTKLNQDSKERKMAHIHCEFTPLMIKVTAFISQKKKAHMVQRLERVLNLSSTKADSWSGLPHHGVWDLARTYVTHVCDCQKSRCTVCVYDVHNCQETDAQSVCVCVWTCWSDSWSDKQMTVVTQHKKKPASRSSAYNLYKHCALLVAGPFSTTPP